MELHGDALGCEKLNEMRGAVWKCMEFNTVAVGCFSCPWVEATPIM